MLKVYYKLITGYTIKKHGSFVLRDRDDLTIGRRAAMSTLLSQLEDSDLEGIDKIEITRMVSEQ